MAKSDQITAGHRRKPGRWRAQIQGLFDTSTGHSHDGSDSLSLSTSPNTLDGAYNQGGAGSGRAIGVTDGAITMTKDDTGTENVLEISASPSAGADGDGILVTNGANSTGVGIQLANSGSGNDIAGTSDTWTISAAGVAVFDSINTVGVIKFASDTLGTGATMLGYDGSDLIFNAVTGDTAIIKVNDVAVLTVAGAAITLAQATTISLALTVSAGGATITGNSTITGDLAVTGALSFGGALTTGGTLTVDELILDTDGVAPDGTTLNYVVRDNTGDLTLNAQSSKSVILAINNSDEYDFSATAITMNSNNISGVGFIDLASVSLAAFGDNVRIGHDNSGDLTLNVRNGKAVHIAENGTDEYNFTDTEFELASGNDIQFLGNDGILDSAGNEVILVTAVGSAVNYLNVRNAATGDPIILECLGTADKGFEFHNDQNEQILSLLPVASADTELTILNANASDPIIRSTGTADKGVIFQNAASEPTFQIDVTGSAPVNWLTVDASDTGVQVIFANDGEDDIGMLFNAKNAEEMLSLVAVTAAATYIEITSAAAGVAGPIIASQGATNTNIILAPEGTGAVNISPGTVGSKTSPSLIFAGAVGGLDTGLYADVQDELGFTTDGTAAMYIGASQEIMIGLTISTTFTGLTAGAMIFGKQAAVGGTSSNQAALYSYDSGGTTTMATRDEAGVSSDI